MTRRNTCRRLPSVAPYFVHIPLYGSIWGFACASDTLDPSALAPRDVDRIVAQRGLSHLQYYNGATHQAVFAMPNYVRDLVAPAQAGA